MMYSRVSTGSVRQTLTMMEESCLIIQVPDQSPVNTISHSTKSKTTRLLKKLLKKTLGPSVDNESTKNQRLQGLRVIKWTTSFSIVTVGTYRRSMIQ